MVRGWTLGVTPSCWRLPRQKSFETISGPGKIGDSACPVMAHKISYSSLLIRIKTEFNEYACHRNPIRFTISTRLHGPGRLSGYNRPDCCAANFAFSHYEFNLLNVILNILFF